MIVGLDVAVKAALPLAVIQLNDLAFFQQHLDIAINRTQTYIRDLLARLLIYPVCGGMNVRFPDDAVNRCFLSGHPFLFLSFHLFLPYHI